jgi:heme/copper-type cytochrome/quinol oxidase subunit 2
MNWSLLNVIGPRFIKWCLMSGRTNFVSPAIEPRISRQKLTMNMLMMTMMMIIIVVIIIIIITIIMEQEDLGEYNL